MSNSKNVIAMIITISISVFLTSCTTKNSPSFKAQYLGQKPPGMTPEVFAPGIVSTPDGKEFACTFSPDGKEFYFNRSGNIMVCSFEQGNWSAPKPASFNTDYMDHEPHITADGSKLFFGSTRPQPGNTEERQYGIWMTERKADGWGEPTYVGNGMYVTTSQNGNIYLKDMVNRALVRTRLVDGKFSEFEKLEGGVNSPFRDGHPCIAPDESFIIFDSNRPGSHQGEGSRDLYICFRKNDGSWGEAINIGKKLNINASTIVAYISPDGKYIFYNAVAEEATGDSWDIYWVDARIIEELKPNELK